MNYPTDPDDDKKKKEHFGNIGGYSGRSIYALVHLVVAIFAIYLSFKCNKGFKIGSFLVACCCPWIYIIYILIVTGGFCPKKTVIVDTD